MTPKSGWPLAKFFVPSIGSMSHAGAAADSDARSDGLSATPSSPMKTAPGTTSPSASMRISLGGLVDDGDEIVRVAGRVFRFDVFGPESAERRHHHRGDDVLDDRVDASKRSTAIVYDARVRVQLCAIPGSARNLRYRSGLYEPRSCTCSDAWRLMTCSTNIA
jgi:hypothetical protein